LEFADSTGLNINFTPAAISEIGVESIPSSKNFILNTSEKGKVLIFIDQLFKKRCDK